MAFVDYIYTAIRGRRLNRFLLKPLKNKTKKNTIFVLEILLIYPYCVSSYTNDLYDLLLLYLFLLLTLVPQRGTDL
jgi:hypothetical protein